MNKKELVTKWIGDNTKQYQKLLDEKGKVYLVRAYIQKDILNI